MARKFVLVEIDTGMTNQEVKQCVKENLANFFSRVVQVHVNTAKKEKKETK